MNTKYRMDAHVFWVIIVALAIGVAFIVNYFLSQAQTPPSPVLRLSSLTSFSCPSPGANSPGNLNYGISVFTGSGTQYYTECGHLNDAGVWEPRNTCNGVVTIGAADSISAQDCTLTGVTQDNKNITLTVKAPGVSTVSGNMRFYISNDGSAFYARADHDFSRSNLYPNDVDLTVEQAIMPTHQITWGTATCGNNWCQMGETAASCPSDCQMPEMYTYTLTRTDTNMSGIEYGTSRGFTYNLTQTSSTGTGTDNVMLSVLDANNNPVSWCIANPATVPVTGLNGTASFTITCTPTVTNLGSPMFSVRATSTKTPALAISAPLGFSVIAPVMPPPGGGANIIGAGGGGGAMGMGVYACYRSADGTYKWLLSADPAPAATWTRADGMCSSGGTALCYRNSVTNELNYDSYQLGGSWVTANQCSGMAMGDLKRADGTIMTWSQRSGGTAVMQCFRNTTDGHYSWFTPGSAGPNWTATDATSCGGGTVAQQCYRNTNTGTYVWFPTGTAGASYTVADNSNCSGGGGMNYTCYQNDINTQRTVRVSSAASPGANWRVVPFSDCNGIAAGETKNISELPSTTQQCYKNTSTNTYSLFAPGTAGPLWIAVDPASCGGMGNANWVSKTWNFKDGITANSMILNRTDTEYTNYIAQVQAACLLINKSQMTWKPNAGSDAAANWQNFGIPDCSGAGTGGGGGGMGPMVTLTQLFPGQYNNVKFSINVEDQDGIQEFSVKTSGNSFLYGGSPGANGNVGSCTGANPMKSVNSGTVDINPGDFPLQAWVKDCRGNGGSTMPFSVSAPGGGGAGNNWVSKTWNFKDGITANSMILNRTDTEYTNYIAQVQAACLLINKSQMTWKPGAGDDSVANWKNFGIPDCSGTAVVPPGPVPLKSTCFKSPDGTYMWVTPTGMVETGWFAVADSFCSTVVVPPPMPPPPPIPTGPCAPGAKCPESSWCNFGNRCYYPDNQITCTSSWDAKCPAGTTNCRPGDTKCIETGAYGPLDGWCMNAQECYSKTQKYCAPVDTDPTSPMDCPAGMSYCSPNEVGCIGPNEKGPISGWCKNGQSCFLDDSSGMLCVPTKWPAPMPAATGMMSVPPPMPLIMDYRVECPAGSSVCRPDDKYCIRAGGTGSKEGWCGDGAQRCNKKDGTIYCPQKGEACPADTTLCPINDPGCTEPGKYGPPQGWCVGGGMGGGGTVMCYKNDNTGIYCGQVTSTDPKTWETFKCPAETSRCRQDDKYCLEVGEACEVGTGCWCASGMPQYKDGLMRCASMGDDWKDILPPPPDDKDKICVWNPDYNEVKQEELRLDQMEKALKTMGQTEAVRVPIRAKIEAARKILGTLLKMAGESSCGAKDHARFGQDLKKFREEIMKELEEAFREFGFTGDLKGLERELQGRLENLAKDLVRFEAEGDTEALIFIGDLVPEYKELLEALQSGGTDLDIRALQKRLMLLDQKIGDFWASRHNEGNQEFLSKAITRMRENLKMAREKLGNGTGATCKAAGNVIEKIAGMIDRAESAYNQRNIPEAGKLLDQARQAMEQRLANLMWQCIGMPDEEGSLFDFELDIDDAFTSVGGVDESLIAEIANRVAERITGQITLLIDAQLKEATARLAELENVAHERITQSLVALQSIEDQYREAMAELKTAMIEKVKAIERLAQEADASLRAADRTRLYKVLETISTYNWCGRVGDDMRAEADAIVLAFEAGAVKSADVAAFETRVAEATERNGEACYQAGVSRFRDTPSHEWFFPHFQRGSFQGTEDAQGRLTGNVEPGREALGAEAMLTIMRSAGYRGIEGTCPVPADTEGATNVPPWSTCAFKVATSGEFAPPVPLDAAIPRQYVAEMMVEVVQDRGLDDAGFVVVPPTQAPAILASFSDIRTCDVPREVIATMVANGIMTGNPDGTWNCDGNLNRAELATILTRFGDAMEFYGGENPELR